MINKKSKISFITILLVLIVQFVFFSPVVVLTKADNDTYTNVIDDLRKDDNFNLNDYPIVEKKYSLDVIQIAENSNKELYVYVYQPSGTLKATSINISTAINESYSPKNYNLTYINSAGPLQKYIVDDFAVKDDALRYYDIPSIFRAFDETIDEVQDGEIITEKSFAVAKQWTASTVNGNVSYTCLDTEVVEILNPVTGTLRYLDGFQFYVDSCDSHYIAFSTDKEIDKLLEADVSFITRSIEGHENLTGFHIDEYGKPINNDKTIYSDEQVSNPGNGWFGSKHEWKRIEKVSDFIKNENLSEEAEENLVGLQWVLRFTETDYKDIPQLNGVHLISYTEVSEVTILRLKFETNGIVYNLGVVDDKHTLDGEIDNAMSEWLSILITSLVVIVIAVVLIIILVPKALDIAIQCIKAIFKGIWWVIKAPFSLFDKDDKKWG